MELKNPAFSDLAFPERVNEPKPLYLSLHKLRQTFTDKMQAEIEKNHGKMQAPFRFSLVSIRLNEGVNPLILKKLLEQNPDQPILLKQDHPIFLYQRMNNKWVATQLKDRGFLDLPFPKKDSISVTLSPRKSGESITQEMRAEMARGHAFVDYQVEFKESLETPDGPKTRVLVKVIGERRFDYHPLIEALKAYLEIHKRWELSGYTFENPIKEEASHQWCKIVALVQLHVTAFTAQQYCHPDRSFENVKFAEKLFKRVLEIHDYISGKSIPWFPRAFDRGFGFAIIRACPSVAPLIAKELAAGALGGLLFVSGEWVDVDLHAIEALDKASLENMARLEREFFAEKLPGKSLG